MKEITLKIPDDKIDFYLELFERLGLQIQEDFDIPDEHIAIVRERIRKSNGNPDLLLNWDDVKDNFKLK